MDAAEPLRHAPDALAQASDDPLDGAPPAQWAPLGRGALAAYALLTCGAAATACVALAWPAASASLPPVRQRELGAGSDARFEAPLIGVGCSNWYDIHLMSVNMSSVEECKQRCTGTPGCEGIGFQSSDACSGQGSGMGTCHMWMGTCEEHANPCFDNYAVSWSSGPGCPVKKPGDAYVVAILFAGRRELMEILVAYVDRLVSSCALDEVHVWDFTRDKRDAVWIAKISGERPAYEVKYPSGDDFWNPAYHFYADVDGKGPAFRPHWSGASRERTVLVKIDDDVVYMNTSGFAPFTAHVLNHQDTFMVHANVVNNGVAAYYQAQHIPRLGKLHPELLEYPTDEWDQERKKGDDITPGRYGPLLRDSAIALDLHKDFLAHTEDYTWGDGDCLEYRPPGSVGSQGRFSINFFGIRWSNWDRVNELVAYGEDEQVLTVDATDGGLRECMYTSFTVVHWSFGCQTIPQELLLSYEELLEKTKVTSRSAVDEMQGGPHEKLQKGQVASANSSKEAATEAKELKKGKAASANATNKTGKGKTGKGKTGKGGSYKELKKGQAASANASNETGKSGPNKKPKKGQAASNKTSIEKANIGFYTKHGIADTTDGTADGGSKFLDFPKTL